MKLYKSRLTKLILFNNKYSRQSSKENCIKFVVKNSCESQQAVIK